MRIKHDLKSSELLYFKPTDFLSLRSDNVLNKDRELFITHSHHFEIFQQF